MFHALLAEDGESSPPASANFQSAAASRCESDECHRINRIHGETGARPPVESRSISSGVAQSKTTKDFEDQNPSKSEKKLSSDYHVGRIDWV
jgi:hypothetical protein